VRRAEKEPFGNRERKRIDEQFYVDLVTKADMN
jgi:hypothetical protein